MNANRLVVYNDTGTVNASSMNANGFDPFQGLPSPNLGLPFPSSNLIKLSSRKVSYQLTTLGQTTQIYTSPSYTDITALARYFGDWGCSYEIQEGAAHTITVQAPWDTITAEDFNVSLFASEQWELVPTNDTKDLLVNGLLVNPFNSPNNGNNYVILPWQVQIAVQKALENKTNLNLTVTSGSGVTDYSAFQNVAQTILDYKRRGVEGIPSYGQTLKRTAVIDQRNTNNAFKNVADAARNSINAQGSINYVYSTGDLIQSYSINSAVSSFMLPSYRKQINVSGLDPFTSTVYAGWLVKPPSFQFITRNKVQLTQEFVWNEWLQGLYYIHSNISNFPLTYVPTGNPAQS